MQVTRTINRTGIALPLVGFFNAVYPCVAYRAVFLSLVMMPTPDAVPIFRYRENILPMDTVKQQSEAFSRQAVMVVAILAVHQCRDLCRPLVVLKPGMCAITNWMQYQSTSAGDAGSALVSLSGCTTSAHQRSLTVQSQMTRHEYTASRSSSYSCLRRLTTGIAFGT